MTKTNEIFLEIKYHKIVAPVLLERSGRRNVGVVGISTRIVACYSGAKTKSSFECGDGI